MPFKMHKIMGGGGGGGGGGEGGECVPTLHKIFRPVNPTTL